MPLERLVLTNFQKHRSIAIDFDPHVTTIVGASASGKTAILRALGLVCLNRPRGKNFVRNRKGACRVTLKVDGHKITRKVGSGVNSYHLDRNRYVSFGSGKVPEPVNQILRLGPVNFQRQLDPVFLFSESPGQVSRALNEVINLDVIDRVLSAVSITVRDAEKDLTYEQTELDEAEELAKSFAFVSDLVADFAELQTARTRYEKASHYNARARRRLNRATESRRKLRPLFQAKGDARLLIATSARLSTLRQSNARLTKLVETADELTRLKALLADAVELSTFRDHADKVAEDNRTSAMYIDQATETRRRLCQIQKDLIARRSELTRLESGRCPVCRRPLRKSS